MDTLFQDLRFGMRSLLRAPGFAIAAILTLTLGIAATTVVFSLINMILLRPIAAHEPERLFRLNDQTEGGRMSMNGFTAVPPARLASYEEVAGDLVKGIAGMRPLESALRTDAGAEIVDIVVVTPNFFEVLGLGAAAGRLLNSTDDAGGEPTAVLSYRAWKMRYGGAPDIVGQTIYLNGNPHKVVGVVQEGFRGVQLGAADEIWVPMEAYRRLHPTGRGRMEGSDVWVTGIGRLGDGVELSTAQAALAAAAPNIPFPDENITVPTTVLESMSLVPRESRGQMVPFLTMFFVTALLVLLIAATNVTGMLLARATGRAREVAVRVAVGADRKRIVRQLVTEGVLIFMLGSAAALLLTFWLGNALPAWLPADVGEVLQEIQPDGRVLAFGVLLSLVAGLAFTIVPAVQVARTDLVTALKDGSAGAGSRRMRLRSTFVVAQVAMSLVLLIVAGLFARTINNSTSGDIGFQPHGVVTAAIRPETQGYDPAAATRLADEMLRRVEAMPGVDTASLTMFPPMSGFVWNTSVSTPEMAGDTAGERISDVSLITPGYFATLQIPLVAGRDFNSGDVDGAPAVAIVNEALADTLWPGQNPLGRRFTMDGEQIEVVGLTPTGKYHDMRDDRVAILYRPIAQVASERYTVLARTSGEAAPLLAAIRRTLAELDPDLALERPMPMDEMIAATLGPQQLAAALIGSFGVIGLLLSAIGLYGVLSYHVGQRTREIGIRIALGARARAVTAMVMRHGTRLALIGIVIGVVVSVAATRLLASLLYGVSATDGLTFASVCILLSAVAILASWLPARRATRVDPTVALRAE